MVGYQKTCLVLVVFDAFLYYRTEDRCLNSFIKNCLLLNSENVFEQYRCYRTGDQQCYLFWKKLILLVIMQHYEDQQTGDPPPPSHLPEYRRHPIPGDYFFARVGTTDNTILFSKAGTCFSFGNPRSLWIGVACEMTSVEVTEIKFICYRIENLNMPCLKGGH